MIKKDDVPNQVLYLNRWVDKDHFRAYVYNETGKKLANTYEEFECLIASGLWAVEKSKVDELSANEPENYKGLQGVTDLQKLISKRLKNKAVKSN